MEHSFKLVCELVKDFQQHEEAYLSPQYQEQQVRQDFIDKFFIALGWDVNHERQKNPYEQEVHIENKMKSEGTQRWADYAFFTAPNFRDVKFFAEAKKPSHDLLNSAYYYQTARYGWSQSTPIAVLTDFEEFHILDCRYKPDPNAVLNRKLKKFHYSQYADEEIFRQIYFLFGRDAVASGSIEKFAESLPKPRGKAKQKALFKGGFQQVDEAFLETLDGYRRQLAKSFKKYNPHLDSETLTEAVQRTLDRLVFIRFLEDKWIEEPSIGEYQHEVSPWNAFIRHCHTLEPRYNGLIFKRHPVLDDPGFTAPDEKVFTDICEDLADESSPYNFSIIPISILGSIYERFLGKVIVAKDHAAVVEEKPEVRKAGGVYYTPEYIVRYIVNETVGKLLYGSRVSGIGDRGQGLGDRVEGTNQLTQTTKQKGEAYGTAIVQGVGSVEEGDVSRGVSVSPEQTAAEGRTVRSEESDATGGGVDPGEHRGGIREESSRGIPSASLDRTGIVDGTGDAHRDRTSSSVHRHTTEGNSGEVVSGRRQNDDTTDPSPEKTLNPNPETLTPIPETLFRLTPDQVKDLKIIDIACGSGSFLLEVYHYLLDYHTKYYTAHPDEAKPGDVEKREGRIVLSHKKRKEILLNNVFGVDIDPQAVEVTQLSLYLKLMEEATVDDTTKFRKLHERMLPDLKKNIVCGNSLIGRDILEGKENTKELEHELKPMDFEQVFPEIMKPRQKDGRRLDSSSGQGGGGFDAVVGNPPYVRPHNLSSIVKEYFWEHFATFRKKSDLYCCFIEKAIAVSKERGGISYIVSDGWLRLDSFEELRKHILANCIVEKLVDLPDKVFADATVKTGIFKFSKCSIPDSRVENTIRIDNYDEVNKRFVELRQINQTTFETTYKNIFDTSLSEELHNLKSKMVASSNALGEIVDIRFGLKTGDDSKFLHFERKYKEDEPLIRGEDVQRYSMRFNGEYVWYVPEKMRKHRNTARPGESERFEQPKILIKDTSSRLGGTLDLHNYYAKDVLIITKKPEKDVSLHYILGILNSSAMRFYYESTFPTLHVQNEELCYLPIRTINFDDPTDKARHDCIVSLVDQMLSAKSAHAAATTDSEKTRLESHIESLDRQIDQQVYELYGLTEEEIKIVEGNGHA